MTNVTINDTSVKPVLESGDFVPIWDTNANEQKKINPSVLASCIGTPHFGLPSTRWFLPHLAIEATTTTTINVPALRLQCVPLFLPRSAGFSAIGAFVSTAAAGLFRLGVHKLDNAAVGILLGEVELSSATTGFKSSALALNLNPGWYGLSILPNATVGIAGYFQSANAFLFGSSSPIGTPAGNVGSNFQTTLASYGSLPNPPGVLSIQGGAVPAIWLQAT